MINSILTTVLVLLSAALYAVNSEAKVIIEAEGNQYSCTKVKSCEDKLKDAYAQIAKLKKQIKDNDLNHKTVVMVKEVLVEAKQSKNTLSLDVRKDFTGISTRSSGPVVTVEAEKNIVVGLNYYRHLIFGTKLGAGAGLDTNGVPKLVMGFDF